MDLGRAASYFSDTWVSGWNGTRWVDEVTTVTVDPFDRFISERQFGTKRRMLLVRPDDTEFDKYPVIKLPSGDVYLVGTHNSDIQDTEYSRVFLIHRAQYFGTLYGFTKTTAASGMAKTASRSQLGQYWCDVERVTMSNSKEFDNISFSQVTVTLPRDCVVDTDNELLAAGKYHDIREVEFNAGFQSCRALAKRSA